MKEKGDEGEEVRKVMGKALSSMLCMQMSQQSPLLIQH